MNIINNTFNLHNCLLNIDNRYIKITQKFKLMGISNFKPTYDIYGAGGF